MFCVEFRVRTVAVANQLMFKKKTKTTKKANAVSVSVYQFSVFWLRHMN